MYEEHVKDPIEKVAKAIKQSCFTTYDTNIADGLYAISGSLDKIANSLDKIAWAVDNLEL